MAKLPTEAEWEYAASGGALDQKWAGTDLQEELGKIQDTQRMLNHGPVRRNFGEGRWI